MRGRSHHAALFLVAGAVAGACGSAPGASSAGAGASDASTAGGGGSDQEAGSIAGGQGVGDGGPSSDGGTGASSDGSAGAVTEAGYPLADGAVIRADRFVTTVVSFSPTGCTGFGQSAMPGIVEGPPIGKGSGEGSTDVVSLGSGGSIVVSFAPNAIIDGPGPDFIVFENPFWIGGYSSNPYAEPGEVSVSDDGTTWTTFPCVPVADPQTSTGVTPPYPAACGGWQIVYSAPTNAISPVDPTTAGGLALDLAAIGVTHARYVRIVDKTQEACPEGGAGLITNGFDLDAISIVNAELP